MEKAVAEHQLPWINVRNIGEPDVAVMYGVSGYPTKYVIDPEGKIAKQVVGEDPEFYMYLEALMNDERFRIIMNNRGVLLFEHISVV